MPTKKEVEALALEYNRTRNERLKLDQESAKLKVREESILDSLTAAKVTSGTYGKVSIEVSTKKVPRCTDWTGFHAYLIQTGNLDMLHKRLTETAVMARVDNGEYVPGIVTDEKTSYKVGLA
jgi:hypothetical protein